MVLLQQYQSPKKSKLSLVLKRNLKPLKVLKSAKFVEKFLIMVEGLVNIKLIIKEKKRLKMNIFLKDSVDK